MKKGVNTTVDLLEVRAKLKKDDGIIDKAYEQLDRVSWNDTELLSYDQAEKYEGAYHASLAQKFDEGEKMGIEKGEKGAFFKVAKVMLKQGFSMQNIKAVTGLSEKEISNIQP